MAVMLVGAGLLLCLTRVGHAQGRLSYKQSNLYGFDMRASYLATVAVDGLQTSRFPRMGITEWNPFVSPFVTPKRIGNGTFAVASVLAVSTIDWGIQQLRQEDQPLFYTLAFGLHAFAVVHNRKFGLKGMPILLPSAWTRPLERRSKSPAVRYTL